MPDACLSLIDEEIAGVLAAWLQSREIRRRLLHDRVLPGEAGRPRWLRLRLRRPAPAAPEASYSSAVSFVQIDEPSGRPTPSPPQGLAPRAAPTLELGV